MLYRYAHKELLPRIDRVTRQFGYYTTYRLGDNEYIGSLPQAEYTLKDTISFLLTAEYEQNHLSAAKRHPKKPSVIDDASYRRVPNQHPTGIPSEFGESWSPKDCQFHVHLFEMEDSIDFFSHYELRPDILTPSFDAERLTVHYRPEWGVEYFQGITDTRIEKVIKKESSHP